MPKLTAGGVGLGEGLHLNGLRIPGQGQGEGQNVTFDNFASWIPLLGDANIDGVVDDKDASALGTNWQVQSGATWFMGDFNFDKKSTTRTPRSWQPIMASRRRRAAAVPEPSTAVLLLGLALAGLAAWRRR